eukprot:scaffold8040_cov17-Tisochrysis_lutea.AAC.1
MVVELPEMSGRSSGWSLWVTSDEMTNALGQSKWQQIRAGVSASGGASASVSASASDSASASASASAGVGASASKSASASVNASARDSASAGVSASASVNVSALQQEQVQQQAMCQLQASASALAVMVDRKASAGVSDVSIYFSNLLSFVMCSACRGPPAETLVGLDRQGENATEEDAMEEDATEDGCKSPRSTTGRNRIVPWRLCQLPALSWSFWPRAPVLLHSKAKRVLQRILTTTKFPSDSVQHKFCNC